MISLAKMRILEGEGLTRFFPVKAEIPRDPKITKRLSHFFPFKSGLPKGLSSHVVDSFSCQCFKLSVAIALFRVICLSISIHSSHHIISFPGDWFVPVFREQVVMITKCSSEMGSGGGLRGPRLP